LVQRVMLTLSADATGRNCGVVNLGSDQVLPATAWKTNCLFISLIAWTWTTGSLIGRVEFFCNYLATTTLSISSGKKQ